MPKKTPHLIDRLRVLLNSEHAVSALALAGILYAEDEKTTFRIRKRDNRLQLPVDLSDSLEVESSVLLAPSCQ